MAKKRKVKVTRLLIVLLPLFTLVIVAGLFLFYIINNQKQKVEFDINELRINEIDHSESKTFDIGLNAENYLLMRLNDFKVLYEKGNDKQIYPASLTKVLTMDAVLKMCDDLNETTSFTNKQRDQLIEENASLAYLKPDEEYTVDEALYALVLPSGADAAVSLENYATNKGKNLVDEMNDLCSSLNLTKSNFTNTTGLHDENLYTSLNNYSEIVIDAILEEEGLKILSTPEITIKDGIKLKSTLRPLCDRNDNIYVHGGKTGYTPEAGTNLLVLYEVNNRSYLLVLANAPGNPYVDGYKTIEDAEKIFNYLYK